MLEIITTWIAEKGLNDELQSAILSGLSGIRLILKGNKSKLYYSTKKLCEDIHKIKPDFKVMVDLPGSRPRFGEFNNPIIISKNNEIKVSFESCADNDLLPSINLKYYSDLIHMGDRLLVNDGDTTFIVTEKASGFIKIRLEDDNAIILPNRSINLPDSNVFFQALTQVDIEMLSAFKEVGINMIALSMVNSDTDMVRIKDIISSLKINAEVIAKIETPQALQNLKEIAVKSDALMIARGDLTTMCKPTNIFYSQREIIKTGQELNKSVISATGLLSSLSNSNEPSISELCDIGYLIESGISRFLISDADLALNRPSAACKWISNLSYKLKENDYELR